MDVLLRNSVIGYLTHSSFRKSGAGWHANTEQMFKNNTK